MAVASPLYLHILPGATVLSPSCLAPGLQSGATTALSGSCLSYPSRQFKANCTLCATTSLISSHTGLLWSSSTLGTHGFELRTEREPTNCKSSVITTVCRTGVRAEAAASAVYADEDTVIKEESVKKSSGYRPVVILPGLGNNTADYNELVASLEARGLKAIVAQVSRLDWLRNAAGLLDANYWKGSLQPRPVLDWYLERTKNAIAAAKAMGQDSQKVSVIGHSAGGWLARVFMTNYGTDDIDLLLTLGTPHLPPPRGVRGVVDQTRGLLYYVEENCPGAFHAPDVKYVCIAGRFLKGERFLAGEETPVAAMGIGTVASMDGTAAISAAQEGKMETGVGEVIQDGSVKPAPPTLRARIVGQGYKQVCGEANVWGDGVVPEMSAHLEGAINLTLDGVYHSPVGANEERPWYGTTSILDRWIHHLQQ